MLIILRQCDSDSDVGRDANPSPAEQPETGCEFRVTRTCPASAEYWLSLGMTEYWLSLALIHVNTNWTPLRGVRLVPRARPEAPGRAALPGAARRFRTPSPPLGKGGGGPGKGGGKGEGAAAEPASWGVGRGGRPP
jgi:hypothetical protein